MRLGLHTTFYIRQDRSTPEMVQVMVDTLLHAGFEIGAVTNTAPPSDGCVRYWTDLDEHGPVPLSEAIAATERVSHFWTLYWQKRTAGGEVVELNTSVVGKAGDTQPSPILVVSMGIDFPDPNFDPFLAEEFLSWSILIADVMQPLYGWSGGSYGLMGQEVEEVSAQAVVSCQPLPIEWANFFGRDYIQQIGLATIHSTPAWRIEFLASEGVVIVLGPRRDSKVSLETAAKVAEHLGMVVA